MKKLKKRFMENIDYILKKGGYYVLECFSKKHIYSTKNKRNWTLKNMHYSHFFTKKKFLIFSIKNSKL
jgi:hypothetical protein